jgi:hypothetical protein
MRIVAVCPRDGDRRQAIRRSDGRARLNSAGSARPPTQDACRAGILVRDARCPGGSFRPGRDAPLGHKFARSERMDPSSPEEAAGPRSLPGQSPRRRLGQASHSFSISHGSPAGRRLGAASLNGRLDLCGRGTARETESECTQIALQFDASAARRHRDAGPVGRPRSHCFMAGLYQESGEAPPTRRAQHEPFTAARRRIGRVDSDSCRRILQTSQSALR